MKKTIGLIWILGAILLFISDFFILANKLIIDAAWASMASTFIAFLVCPVLMLIGVWILIMGGKK